MSVCVPGQARRASPTDSEPEATAMDPTPSTRWIPSARGGEAMTAVYQRGQKGKFTYASATRPTRREDGGRPRPRAGDSHKQDSRTWNYTNDSRNRSAYGLLSRAGRLVQTSAMLVRAASTRHRPARVPAARRVSMAGESALDQCSNGIVFSCVKLSFK
ncbi:unnamed protein product, partial [Nesidiocoris tenuis]